MIGLGRCLDMCMIHFCVRVGKVLDLYVMFCDWVYNVKVFGLSFDLLRHINYGDDTFG